MDQNGTLNKRDFIAVLPLFLVLPLVYFLAGIAGTLPQWLELILAFGYAGGLLVAFILAITRGLPRWSPPYLGFLLLLGLTFSQFDRFLGWIFPYFTRSFGPRSLWPLPIRLIYGGIFEFIWLFTILMGVLILINLLRLLPYTRGVWLHVRADWTLLSFMLYGLLVLGIHLVFEGYQHEDSWKLLAWMFLAAGAWSYFRAEGQKGRILALLGGVTGAMWTVAIAKWILIPLQDWESRYSLISMEDLRWTETGGALIAWGLILVIMIAPVLLDVLPAKTTLQKSPGVI